MIPAAWSSWPDTGLNRTVAVRSVYTTVPSRTAGKSSPVAVWSRTFGLDGASGSARTSQLPPKTSLSDGALPTSSRPNDQSADWQATAVLSVDWYFKRGVPSQPTAATNSAMRRQAEDHSRAVTIALLSVSAEIRSAAAGHYRPRRPSVLRWPC